MKAILWSVCYSWIKMSYLQGEGETNSFSVSFANTIKNLIWKNERQIMVSLQGEGFKNLKMKTQLTRPAEY